MLDSRYRLYSVLILSIALSTTLFAAPAAHAWFVEQSGPPQCADQELAWSSAVVPATASGAGDVVAELQRNTLDPLTGSCRPADLVVRLSARFGAALWEREVTSSSNVYAVATDAQGSAMVAGLGRVTKLRAADGATLWTSSQAGVNSGDWDVLAVDGAGDVLAVGGDVYKLDGETGARLWRYTATAGGAGYLRAIALDPATGDVIAAGHLSGSPQRIFVVRLAAATGAEIWRYASGSEGSVNDAQRVTSLPDGDVLVGAVRTVSGVFRAEVMRLDGTTGIEEWRQRSATDANCRWVGSDPSGTLVGAVTQPFSGTARTIVALDAFTGAVSWSEASVPSLEVPLAIDGDGSFFTHRARDDADPSFRSAVVKLDGATGLRLWTTYVSPVADPPRETAVSLHLDPAGDVAMAGWRFNVAAAFVRKLDGADGSDVFGPAICGEGSIEPGEGCDDGNATPGDGCSDTCAVEASWTCPAVGGIPCEPTCGDGVRVGRELDADGCDDGGLATGDGCDASCRTELVVPPTSLTAGQAVATGSEATPDAPVQAAVQTPNAGTVSIVVTSAVVPQPTGFALLGRQIDVAAPPASESSPLTLTFRVEAALVPGGDPGSVVVYRNGVALAECPGSTTTLPGAQPCVSARTVEGDDVLLVVRTAAASVWSLAAPIELAPAVAACRKEIRKQIGTQLGLRLNAMQKCIDALQAGKVSSCPDEKTGEKIAAVRAKLDPAKLAAKCPAAILEDVGLRDACAGATHPTLLASCVGDAIDGVVASLLDTEYADAGSVLSSVLLRVCQAAIAKTGITLVRKRGAARTSCQDKAEAGKLPGCPDAKTADKLAKADAAMARGIAIRCTDSAVADLSASSLFGGSCAAAATVPDLVSCQLADHRAAEGLLDVLR